MNIILNANQVPPLTGQRQGTRINFHNYDQIIQRIQQSPKFYAHQRTVSNDPLVGSQANNLKFGLKVSFWLFYYLLLLL